MKANDYYANRDSSFWAYVRFLSEKLGYSKKGIALVHNKVSATEKLIAYGITIENDKLVDALEYIKYRAELLNENKNNLMDVEEAKNIFETYKKKHEEQNFICGLPLNKQKNEKKSPAFFTGIINILTEETIREFARKKELIYGKEISFSHDPHELSYVLNKEKYLEGSFSRRFDGAFPKVNNAHLIWEIKEYYYTTTFGSRISSGVYETQLDGYEALKIKNETGVNVKHVFMIDSYQTWWLKGIPYLCRTIDMLNMGLVDEVILGKEVIKRWPIILNETLENYKIDYNNTL